MLSMKFKATICHSVSPQTTTQVVTFASNDPQGAISPNVMTPNLLRTALSPSREKALSLPKSKSWVCGSCNDDARHLCSSIVAYREEWDKATLCVDENIHLSCLSQQCMSEARRRRNADLKTGSGVGVGFRLAFRCAQEPIIVEDRCDVDCTREWSKCVKRTQPSSL